jgi:hypothetical protein
VNKTEGTHFTVTGRDTSTVTVTMNEGVDEGDTVFIRLRNKRDSGGPTSLMFMTGKNLASDGQGSTTNIRGAHHTDAGNPSGHNDIAYGSLGVLRAGCSYSSIGGSAITATGTRYAFGRGARHQLFGNGPAAVGQNNYVEAHGFSWGEDALLNKDFGGHQGRGGVAGIAGEFVHSAGQKADPARGQAQHGTYLVRKTLTSSSNSDLQPINGSTVYDLPLNSTALVKGLFLLQDRGSDDFRELEIRLRIKRDETGSTTLLGQFEDAPLQYTIVDDSGNIPGAGAWQVQGFDSGSNGGFLLVGRGEDGKSIELTGRVEVLIGGRTRAIV